MMIREAIVLAGGLGTRLQPVVQDVPKAMAVINGRPFLEYLLDYLLAYDIEHVVLSVGHLNEAIRTHFKDRYGKLYISYAVENSPLGTGGGIRHAFSKIKGEEAFILNGDTLFLANLEKMYLFHSVNNGMATIALHYAEDAARYGSVVLNHEHRIRGFKEKNEDPGPGYINGGIYCLNKETLTSGPFPDRFSVERDFFELYFMDVPMLGFISDAYFLDIGIPGDYEKAKDEFKRLEYR